MFIPKEINDAINEMISIELTASKQYLAIGAKFLELGLPNIGKKFLEEAGEEQGHAIKEIEYLIKVGGKVKFLPERKFKQDFKNAEEMIQTALKMEEDYLDYQTKLMNKVKSLKDNLTENFLKWFLDNQVEEINKYQDFLMRLKKLGEQSLYLLDASMGK